MKERPPVSPHTVIARAGKRGRALARRLGRLLGRQTTESPPVPLPPLDPRPGLSVVLGTLDRKPLLQAAIESVRRETRNFPSEIIVIDGGSRDGSIDWLTAQPDIVTIVQHNRVERDGRKAMRRSWGSFINLGFRTARADAVLMISDDCLLLPGSVAAGLARLRQDGAEPVGGVAFYFRDWPLDADYYVQLTLGGTLMVNHGLFSRAALAAVDGAEEERYRFYKADGDLSIRITRAGFRIVDCPQAVVEHYLDPDEALRIDNNATLEHDRAVYLARWRDELGPRLTEGMGRKTIAFRDPQKLAEQVFGPIAAARRGAA